MANNNINLVKEEFAQACARVDKKIAERFDLVIGSNERQITSVCLKEAHDLKLPTSTWFGKPNEEDIASIVKYMYKALDAYEQGVRKYGEFKKFRSVAGSKVEPAHDRGNIDCQNATYVKDTITHNDCETAMDSDFITESEAEEFSRLFDREANEELTIDDATAKIIVENVYIDEYVEEKIKRYSMSIDWLHSVGVTEDDLQKAFTTEYKVVVNGKKVGTGKPVLIKLGDDFVITATKLHKIYKVAQRLKKVGGI